ncbi:MAG TPA: hypothetical protein DCO79_13410 [Spirochaeta sp.]|nr:hypothetical protein [Spirochaeta sp.]
MTCSLMINNLIADIKFNFAYTNYSSILNLVFFEDRKFGLVVLNSGYAFVSFNIIAILMTLW